MLKNLGKMSKWSVDYDGKIMQIRFADHKCFGDNFMPAKIVFFVLRYCYYVFPLLVSLSIVEDLFLIR